MQAYATAERPGSGELLHTLDLSSPRLVPRSSTVDDSGGAVLDQLLAHLADLIAERLIERIAASANDEAGEWMDARQAAAYLGVHRDTLRKLAAERAIPAHQDGPRCKLYFRRDELDDWRRSARHGLRALS